MRSALLLAAAIAFTAVADAQTPAPAAAPEIGRASCRERV